MAIKYEKYPTLNEMDVLACSTRAVDTLAMAAIVNMIEANLDMVEDCPRDYKTKQDIENCLAASNEQAVDFINDVIEDLRMSLISRLRNGTLTAVVTAMHFDPVDGRINDVDVQVKFE